MILLVECYAFLGEWKVHMWSWKFVCLCNVLQTTVEGACPAHLDRAAQPPHLLHPPSRQQHKVHHAICPQFPSAYDIFIFSLTYLEVNNYLINKTITNVIATVYGAVEPGKMCHSVKCRLRFFIFCNIQIVM